MINRKILRRDFESITHLSIYSHCSALFFVDQRIEIMLKLMCLSLQMACMVNGLNILVLLGGFRKTNCTQFADLHNY